METIPNIPAPAANSAILEKIEALLNKANGKGTTEAESAAFFAKASELMTKYGIEQHQLGNKNEDTDKVTQVPIEGRTRTERPAHYWVRVLIKHCFHVSVIRHAVPGLVVRYSLIGTKEDCAFAAYAFNVLSDTFLRLQNEYLRKYNQPRTPRVYNAYFRGLCNGFCRAWDDAQEATMRNNNAQSYAIVLVDKDKAIARFMDDAKIGLQKKKEFNGDPHALLSGMRDGRSIKLSRPLNSGSSNNAQLK